jgi:hypothetical protein
MSLDDLFTLTFFTQLRYLTKGACQRFALAAGGRDEIRFESRKNSKPEKCLKVGTNPTSRLHALLARFLVCATLIAHQ